jgi:hypothetical protein
MAGLYNRKWELFVFSPLATMTKQKSRRMLVTKEGRLFYQPCAVVVVAARRGNNCNMKLLEAARHVGNVPL